MKTRTNEVAVVTAKKVAAISAATIGGIVSMPFVVAGTAIYDALGIVGGVLVDPIKNASEYKALTPAMPIVNAVSGALTTAVEVPMSIVAGPKAVGNEIYSVIMGDDQEEDPGMSISEVVEFISKVHQANETIIPKPGVPLTAATIAVHEWCTNHQNH